MTQPEPERTNMAWTKSMAFSYPCKDRAELTNLTITDGLYYGRSKGEWKLTDSMPEVKQCFYCGSRCDDIRGNCGACGAPKHEEIRFGELWS